MYRQQGLTTLLVTTMVLVVSLIFTLASYKNVFYQIKRTQNEVLARKAHWWAEGGIECAFAALKVSLNPQDADNPGFFPNECSAELGVKISAVKKDNKFTLSSTFTGKASSIVKKTVELSSIAKKTGAIQTGSNMYSYSSLSFYNPDPGKFTGDGWECVALRYRGEYNFNGGIENKGLLAAPNSSFDARGKDCLSSHKTVGTLKKDIVHDPDLSPFKDYFGVSDAKHDTVRDERFDIVIKEAVSPIGDYEYSGITNCGEAISNALAAGHDSIWVEGSCEIAGKYYTDIVEKSNKLNGIMILVHDGMFSVFPKSSTSDMKYQGIIFHYNLDYKYNFNDWKDSKAYAHLNHKPSVFKDKVNLASYYLHGALNINGASILDAKHYDNKQKKYISQNALLFDSFGMTFNAKYFSKFRGSEKGSGGGTGEVRWLKGSWHDF